MYTGLSRLVVFVGPLLYFVCVGIFFWALSEPREVCILKLDCVSSSYNPSLQSLRATDPSFLDFFYCNFSLSNELLIGKKENPVIFLAQSHSRKWTLGME